MTKSSHAVAGVFGFVAMLHPLPLPPLAVDSVCEPDCPPFAIVLRGSASPPAAEFFTLELLLELFCPPFETVLCVPEFPAPLLLVELPPELLLDAVVAPDPVRPALETVPDEPVLPPLPVAPPVPVGAVLPPEPPWAVSVLGGASGVPPSARDVWQARPSQS